MSSHHPKYVCTAALAGMMILFPSPPLAAQTATEPGPAPLQDESEVRLDVLEARVSTGSASDADHLALARLYLDAERFWEARQMARAVLANTPGSAEASELERLATEGLGRVQRERMREAEAMLDRRDLSASDRRIAADMLFEGGQYLAAAEQYALLPESERDRATRLRHARALAWSGRLDDAERIYIALDPASDPNLGLEYGRLLSWMGARNAALRQLREVYDRTPTDEAAIALANAMAWSGNREGALELLATHLERNPTAGGVRELRTTIQESPDLRLERLDRMIELEPFNLSLRLERARMLIDMERYSAALTELETIDRHGRERDDEVRELQQRARSLRDEQLALAEQRRRELDLRDPDTAPAILELARSYSGLGDYRRAAQLYERYLALQPDDVEARISYARVLQWDRRWDASAREYERILADHPDRADLRLEHARVLSYDRRFIPAVRVLNSLVDLEDHPRSHLYADVPVEARYSLGQIYRWYGWNDHAVEHQTAALDLDAGFDPARRELDIVRHLRPATTFQGRYTHYENSSDFEMDRFDLEMFKWNSRRTAWNVDLGRHHFDHRGLDYQATSIGVGGRYRQSDQITPRARLGLNIYDDDLGTRPWWNLGVDWVPSLQSRAALEYAHYDLVYDVHNVRSLAEDPLTIDDLRAHYDHHTGGYWAWLGDLSYGRISDDNTRFGAHGLVSFRVMSSPYVAVKGDFRYLSHDFRSDRYWSPTDYTSAAAVLHVGGDVRQRFFWDAELKYGRAWEQDFESDIRAIEARVTVPITEAIDLIGNYAYGESGRLEALPAGNDFVNYWQNRFFIGIRLKRRFDDSDRDGARRYYFDDTSLSGSPVIPQEVR